MGIEHYFRFQPPVKAPPVHLTNPVTDSEVEAVINSQSGWDRVRHMYSGIFKFGRHTPEFVDTSTRVFSCGVVAFIASALAAGRQAGRNHIETAIALRYETKFKALRHYNDAIVGNAVWGGLRYAIRFSVLTGILLFTADTIAIYRNKSGIIEYGIGAAAAGTLYRLNDGLRAMFASGLIMGVPGFLIGCLVYQARKYTHTTVEGVRFKRVKELLTEEREQEELMSRPPLEPLMQSQNRFLIKSKHSG